MVQLQGSELTKEIAAINPKIKMVFLTAYDNVTNNDLNLEIIKKPITINRLLQIIQRHLN